MVALQAAVARKQIQRSAIVRVVRIRALPDDVVLAVQTANGELATSDTAVDRRRILPPFVRIAVENGSDELH